MLLATAAGLLGARWSAAGGLVVELGSAPAGAPVTARLAEVLRDPSLELRLRLTGGEWTDEAGHPAARPRRRGRRSARSCAGGSTTGPRSHCSTTPRRSRTARRRSRRSRWPPPRSTTRAATASCAPGSSSCGGCGAGCSTPPTRSAASSRLELRSGPLREAEALERLLRDVPEADALRDELARARAELADIAQGLYPTSLLERGLAGSLADARRALAAARHRSRSTTSRSHPRSR